MCGSLKSIDYMTCFFIQIPVDIQSWKQLKADKHDKVQSVWVNVDHFTHYHYVHVHTSETAVLQFN